MACENFKEKFESLRLQCEKCKDEKCKDELRKLICDFMECNCSDALIYEFKDLHQGDSPVQIATATCDELLKVCNDIIEDCKVQKNVDNAAELRDSNMNRNKYGPNNPYPGK